MDKIIIGDRQIRLNGDTIEVYRDELVDHHRGDYDYVLKHVYTCESDADSQSIFNIIVDAYRWGERKGTSDTARECRADIEYFLKEKVQKWSR